LFYFDILFENLASGVL